MARHPQMGLRDQWYKNAIIYCLDVETYADSDGDGIGDFQGLTRRLDYLAGLGITCIWLMPFYPTPNRDDGYDVMDYVSVDQRLGNIGDFTEFIIEANERGIRVIIDLVPNHTSIDHPWFQAARKDPDSKYRDYYVWRHDDPGDTSDQVVFPGKQDGIWTYDEEAGAWYLHHFYSHQPDLNFANPAVRDEFKKIMGFWLELGVSGFRIDAAPFLISLQGIDQDGGGMDMAHGFLEELRDFATIRKGNAILLGEVDEGLSTIADYFGGGSELQALFNFPMNRFTFLGLAQQSGDPINFGLAQIPTIPGMGQWVNFLRHHDELNLSRITKEQRDTVFEAFGSDPEYQIYGRGLRRRLAPMLEGDVEHLRLAFSVLFSLPGAPMIYYGEEIGMGEQLELEGRLAVRSPMQWTSYDNGGFSSAPLDRLVRPIVDEGDFRFECTSVSRQRGDQGSLLNWLVSLIRVRKECGEIGVGEWSLVETGKDAIFAIRFDDDDSSVIVVNNLSPDPQSIKLDIPEDQWQTATDLLTDRAYESIGSKKGRMRINGYGFRWLRIGGIY